jgi:tetratricopeptide (TPR) repeat protein
MTTAVQAHPHQPDPRRPLPKLEDEIAAISAALRQRSPTGLTSRIEAARTAWPQDLKLRLLEGEWHERSGRLAEAEICFSEALCGHPDNPWPAVRLVGLLLTMRRVPEAHAVFADHVWRAELPEATRTGLLSGVTAITFDLRIRRDYLESLLDGRPDDRFVYLKLAALSFRQRDRAAAERAFEAARRLGPLPVESELLEVELLLALARFDEAFARAKSLVARHPERPDFARRAIQTG